MAESTDVTWVRTNRRAPASSWRDVDATRVAGPWHINTPIGGYTYCGSEVARIVSSLRHVGPLTSPPDGAVCVACLRHQALGRQKPTTNRGRRQ